MWIWAVTMEGAPYPICVCFIVCTVHHSLHFTVHCRPEVYTGLGRLGPSWTPITAQTTNFTHKLAKHTYCPSLHYSNIQLQLCAQLVFDYYISLSEYYHYGRDIIFFHQHTPWEYMTHNMHLWTENADLEHKIKHHHNFTSVYHFC